jgi:hypothetical protein
VAALKHNRGSKSEHFPEIGSHRVKKLTATICCTKRNRGQHILHDLSDKQTVEPLLISVCVHDMHPKQAIAN